MSPIWLAMLSATDTPMICELTPAAAQNAPPTAAAATQPAMVPDQVFFGETRGQNLGPPNCLPAK